MSFCHFVIFTNLRVDNFRLIQKSFLLLSVNAHHARGELFSARALDARAGRARAPRTLGPAAGRWGGQRAPPGQRQRGAVPPGLRASHQRDARRVERRAQPAVSSPHAER